MRYDAYSPLMLIFVKIIIVVEYWDHCNECVIFSLSNTTMFVAEYYEARKYKERRVELTRSKTFCTEMHERIYCYHDYIICKLKENSI